MKQLTTWIDLIELGHVFFVFRLHILDFFVLMVFCPVTISQIEAVNSTNLWASRPQATPGKHPNSFLNLSKAINAKWSRGGRVNFEQSLRGKFPGSLIKDMMIKWFGKRKTWTHWSYQDLSYLEGIGFQVPFYSTSFLLLGK
jgi:hypothetical protein